MKILNQVARLSLGAARLSSRGASLADNFGRKHDYLRASLTERCNLRCRYCMPEGGVELTRPDKCLSLSELTRLTKIFVNFCGVRKIRLTGGEPTIDRKLLPLLSHLNELRDQGLNTVGLTTNGLTLKKNCLVYKDSGLNRVNISLDTLNEKKFEEITRRKGLSHVLEGLERAVEVGFEKVKLNCVVMKDVNDKELIEFVLLTNKYPIEVRFIEFMPFFGNRWSYDKLVPFKDMLAEVLEEFPQLERVEQSANETAKLFKLPHSLGSIGFITSITDNFCSGCNRLRLTADGNLKVCLFGKSEISLRDLMRNGSTDSEIVDTIQRALNGKHKQHGGYSKLQSNLSRPMVKIECNFHSGPQGQSNDNPKGFTHLNAYDKANMVDVGSKPLSRRVAVASGEIEVGKDILDKISEHSMKKGDIITVAKVAGILGAKMTSALIPLCHQIHLDHVHIEIEACQATGSLRVTGEVKTCHRTGVEMEALTAVSVTLLTIYDMCKSVGNKMRINNIQLLMKSKSES